MVLDSAVDGLREDRLQGDDRRPLRESAEPASSNQFCGDSSAYIATLRAPLSTGTTADMGPPNALAANVEVAAAAEVAVAHQDDRSDLAAVLDVIEIVGRNCESVLLLKPRTAIASSAVPTTPIPPSELVVPQTAAGIPETVALGAMPIPPWQRRPRSHRPRLARRRPPRCCRGATVGMRSVRHADRR